MSLPQALYQISLLVFLVQEEELHSRRLLELLAAVQTYLLVLVS